MQKMYPSCHRSSRCGPVGNVALTFHPKREVPTCGGSYWKPRGSGGCASSLSSVRSMKGSRELSSISSPSPSSSSSSESASRSLLVFNFACTNLRAPAISPGPSRRPRCARGFSVKMLDAPPAAACASSEAMYEPLCWSESMQAALISPRDFASRPTSAVCRGGSARLICDATPAGSGAEARAKPAASSGRNSMAAVGSRTALGNSHTFPADGTSTRWGRRELRVAHGARSSGGSMRASCHPCIRAARPSRPWRRGPRRRG
mmetsp:Transcript_18927/g.60458  ORF Transcript_18927/g.60458 Transcript_18927/m.60458 type:complete len:261 (+) Transcript_18927:403-1185(+)